jgi:hypothetical protein
VPIINNFTLQAKKQKKAEAFPDIVPMALNDIQLTTTLLAEIYRDSLVDINDQSQVNQLPSSTSQRQKSQEDNSTTNRSANAWKHLGEFKKRILLVVRYTDVTYIPNEPLNFLTSILGACGLSLADVAIVNVDNLPSVQYSDLRKKFNSAVIMLFGVAPSELEMPLNFPEFQIQPFNNCTFLYTPVLEKLESDKVLKSKLWVCLRRMFDLS